jgi:hypothetical protein
MFRRSFIAAGLMGVVVPCLGLGLACEPLALPQQPAPPSGEGGVGVDGGGSSEGLPLPSFAPPGAIRGEVKRSMNSTLATWATLGDDGKVASIGWNFPMTMVSALQAAAFDQRTFLDFPPEVARDTLVTSMSYGILIAGHLPAGVYNTPHFDFHIAVQAQEEILATDCSDPTMPVDEIVPPGWGLIPPPDNCIVGMGIHCIFFGHPEFNGERFTKSSVLIYYQGDLGLKGKGAKISSFEPKFSNAFINERKDFDIPMPQFPPDSVGRPGLQPTNIRAVYLASEDEYILTASEWSPAD